MKPPTTKPGVTDKPDGETSSPARIGTGDKTPSSTGGEQPVRIGADDSNTVDLWCRGSGCGGSSDKPLLTNEQLTTRGTDGVKLADSPAKGKDYSEQLKNYNIQKEEPEGVDSSISNLDGYKEKYGFDADNEDAWQTVYAQSKNNPVEAVATMSFGRATKDGKDYVAYVAHARFASADGNRYKLTASGDNVKDANGKLVEQPDATSKGAPAYQLVQEAAKVRFLLKILFALVLCTDEWSTRFPASSTARSLRKSFWSRRMSSTRKPRWSSQMRTRQWAKRVSLWS